MGHSADWSDLLQHPAGGNHIVQTWQDESFLADAVAEYIGAGLRAGEAALVVSTPAHFDLFKRKLAQARGAGRSGQLRWLDAEDTLAKFMQDGMPDWTRFHEIAGGLIAELRLQYPAVRIYGEMVDVLFQRGERDAAIRLEEFWNELGNLQTFSLYCAYQLDHLDANSYAALQCVCQVHTHLIPVRDYDSFDDAVRDASKEVLDQPLAQMLLSLSTSQRSSTEMPLGQATLLWLHKNMPRTAEKVLANVRQRFAPA
jgi:hypothetical protein